MSIQDLPGYELANEKGYRLHDYSPSYKKANYVKDGIHLTVNSDRTATLTAFIGIVKLSIDSFSFPHPKFDNFESQIKRIHSEYPE